MSIESAWAALINRPLMGRLATQDVVHKTRTVPAIKAAARALAQATVDAVEATEGEGYEHGMGRWECDFESVRAKIKALGR